MMWPHETWRTKDGGHTYMGFITEREAKPFCKGVVRPVPQENFTLLPEQTQIELREGFSERGYKLVMK